MRITSGKYIDQFAIGITWLRYPNVTWSIIFDFGLWYVEVSNDLKGTGEWIPYFTKDSIKCDRCGSPNDVKPKFPEDEMWELEWLCDECVRYDEYMKSLDNEESKTTT